VSDGRTYHPGEPGGDLDEQHISRMVTEGVVDLFEPVEIKHHDRRLRTAAAGRRQRLRGSIRKQQSVRQPGQRVMQALMPHSAKVASDHQIQPDEQQQGGYWARHQSPDLPMLRPVGLLTCIRIQTVEGLCHALPVVGLQLAVPRAGDKRIGPRAVARGQPLEAAFLQRHERRVRSVGAFKGSASGIAVHQPQRIAQHLLQPWRGHLVPVAVGAVVTGRGQPHRHRQQFVVVAHLLDIASQPHPPLPRLVGAPLSHQPGDLHADDDPEHRNQHQGEPSRCRRTHIWVVGMLA
jgi:hypothetical protein